MRTVEELLGKARNRVRFVGIELEGGWNKLPQGTDGVIRDGSVNFPNVEIPSDIRRMYDSYLPDEARKGAKLAKEWLIQNGPPKHIGELPSTPLKVKDMEAWVLKNYPQRVNETCGLHMHMSFNTLLTYQRLMDKDSDGCSLYEKEMIRLMKQWGLVEEIPGESNFWYRLDGFSDASRRVPSQFCRVGNKMIEEQARINRKNFDHNSKVNRYTAVNYSWGTHGTIELRFLPMFPTAPQAVKALNECLRITNAFILTRIRKEIAEVVSVQNEDMPDSEEYRECV